MNNQAQKLQDMVSARTRAKNTKFIAVTSGKGGVGKSTISANLGNVLAKSGYKVALKAATRSRFLTPISA